MKNGAAETRIEQEAYKARLERARELMRQRGVDMIFATPSRNFLYLSGVDTWRSERLIALLVPLEGQPVTICPAFEEERLRHASSYDSFASWHESEDPYRIVASLLNKLHASHVAVEPSTEFNTYWRLKEAVANATFSDATPIFSALRMQKAPDEIASIREAIRITLQAIAVAQSSLSAGMSELDVLAVIVREMKSRGGAADGGLVQFGPDSALPHGDAGERKLERNTTVLMDVGCRVNGYYSDITRTIFWGDRNPAKFVEVFNTVWRAQQAGFEAARQGVECQEVDRRARAVIESAGYGKYFTHRLGHGMGLDGHEQPYLVEGNRFKLEPGNVVTIEPGIYLPGEFGVRIEDDFLITRTGAEPLSQRITAI